MKVRTGRKSKKVFLYLTFLRKKRQEYHIYGKDEIFKSSYDEEKRYQHYSRKTRWWRGSRRRSNEMWRRKDTEQEKCFIITRVVHFGDRVPCQQKSEETRTKDSTSSFLSSFHFSLIPVSHDSFSFHLSSFTNVQHPVCPLSLAHSLSSAVSSSSSLAISFSFLPFSVPGTNPALLSQAHWAESVILWGRRERYTSSLGILCRDNPTWASLSCSGPTRERKGGGNEAGAEEAGGRVDKLLRWSRGSKNGIRTWEWVCEWGEKGQSEEDGGQHGWK